MIRVAVLDEGLYFPDGQIRDEVYEYGSFLQSRMFHEGVTCSDCPTCTCRRASTCPAPSPTARG